MKIDGHNWRHPHIITTAGGTFSTEQRVNTPHQQLYRCRLTAKYNLVAETFGKTPEEAIEKAARAAGHSLAEQH
jgi:hypothetical protein